MVTQQSAGCSNCSTWVRKPDEVEGPLPSGRCPSRSDCGFLGLNGCARDREPTSNDDEVAGSGVRCPLFTPYPRSGQRRRPSPWPPARHSWLCSRRWRARLANLRRAGRRLQIRAVGVRLNTLRSECRGLGCPPGCSWGSPSRSVIASACVGWARERREGRVGGTEPGDDRAPVSQTLLALGREGAAVRPRGGRHQRTLQDARGPAAA